ncbi:MAG: Fibronectin, type domain protein [Marmoricola sp.]|nr:Fibronectin, type domain protein [Marmoricola sp.]
MTRSLRTGLLLLTLALVVVASSGQFAAAHDQVSARTPRHVLDDGPWPPFVASWDGVDQAYAAATGTDKALLARIALRPRVIWFTSGTQNGHADDTVRTRIQQFQQGDPNAYAQLAIFGMYPKGESHRKDPISAAQQARYRAWIDQIAAGIGDSKVILVLEPDLAVAWGGWHPSVRFAMAAYAAKVLGALPNTKTYLDGSDADWLKPAKAFTMLRDAGISYVDGIALGATHYSSVAGNIGFGAGLIGRLNAAGIKGKGLVIDTADNGRAFTTAQFRKRFPTMPLGNANLCRSRSERQCVTLGIPPTTDVASSRWHLPAAAAKLADRYVDAYLWFGRPWLYEQAAPFELKRALAVASTTPFS